MLILYQQGSFSLKLIKTEIFCKDHKSIVEIHHLICDFKLLICHTKASPFFYSEGYHYYYFFNLDLLSSNSSLLCKCKILYSSPFVKK